jgi:hypothetical protein
MILAFFDIADLIGFENTLKKKKFCHIFLGSSG